MRLLFVPPLLCVGFGVVLQPPSVSVPMPRHSHASSQSKMLPSLHSPSAPSTAATHGVFGAVWSPEEEVMGISVSSDGGAWRASTTAVSLEGDLLYFKELQIAAGLRICL